MHVELQLHPMTPDESVAAIEVFVERLPANRLALGYQLVGALGRLRIAAPSRLRRADGLWRHTCLEAFVRQEGSKQYCELNLAPSLQWAAYRFDDYRSGMREADIEPPAIEVRSGERFELHAELGLDLDEGATWLVGLSAVVEDKGGAKSYWALAHPPGRPDFHHRDCFALRLPPTERP